MEFAVMFLDITFYAIKLISPVFLFLLCIIVVCGQLVGALESWSKFDALYWSFITALTVGYGDYVPVKKLSRCLAVLVALCGIIFSGIVVAITIEATSDAFKKHGDKEYLLEARESLGK